MNMADEIILSGGKIWTEKGFVFRDIKIKNGDIVEIASSIGPSPSSQVISLNGALVLPSFVDMHVHLREPGYSYKETIHTGTLAAAAGGFTTVCTMPNLNPPPDNLQNLNVQLDIIRKEGVVNVLPFATITQGRNGRQLVDYVELAPLVAGFSDDGSGVQDEEVMRKAMEGIAKTGKILAAHCEVECLIKGGYIHEGTYAESHGHKGICSKSEWGEVERDIQLSAETDCRLHICHMSTKESVELVRQAKAKGLKVTCETGPHYLTFTDNDLQEDGRFKMNPPIRSLEDREALRKGIIDGTIDVIATDHAPHSQEEKSKGLEKSAMGVVGLETAFSAVYTSMVDTGLITLEKLVELMAINPRKILGLPFKNLIEQGKSANLTVVDINETYKVDSASFLSLGKATPYDGMTLKGKVKLTVSNGAVVYNAL